MTEGEHIWSAVTFETTLRCDQRCAFCGSVAGRPHPRELSTEEVDRLFGTLAQMGIKAVELSGGETYLRPDWLDVIRLARSHGLQCSMITAGRAVDIHLARAAKEAGLSRVAVSIDGDEATHDGLRGVTGSFEHAVSAVRAFREAGLPVGCNTQLNAKNHRNIEALGEILSGIGLYAWQIQLMIPMGRAIDHPDLILQPYDLLDLVPRVAATMEACRRRGLVVFAGDNLGYFGPHEQTLRRSSARCGHTRGCAAGRDVMSIDQVGQVKGCSALDGADHVIANVRDDDWPGTFRGSPLRQSYGAESAPLGGYCAECYYGSVCRGGCSATAYALTGHPGDNPYCHHRALELARQGVRERLTPTQRRPAGLRLFTHFAIERVPL